MASASAACSGVRRPARTSSTQAACARASGVTWASSRSPSSSLVRLGFLILATVEEAFTGHLLRESGWYRHAELFEVVPAARPAGCHPAAVRLHAGDRRSP